MKTKISTIKAISTFARGEVIETAYALLRGVLMHYDEKKKIISLHYYLDREPTQIDYQIANQTMHNIIAWAMQYFKLPPFEKIEVQCLYDFIPFHELNTMDRVVYASEIVTEEAIIASTRIALWGVIYPAIRQIAIKYDPKEKLILLRYYLDRPPREIDYEEASSVMAEIISNFDVSNFQTVKEECIYSTAPQNKLDPLDGILYARREYDLEDVS